MSDDYTVAMIKGAAVSRGDTLSILTEITERGFRIARIKKQTMCGSTLSAFYHEHEGRSYFPDLAESVRGVTIALVLEHPEGDTVSRWREAIGTTDSRTAPEGTIRAKFGGHVFNSQAPKADNAVHGSGSQREAQYEMNVLFSS